MTTQALTLTSAELDTLRFALGIIDADDFESAADRANFLSVLNKVG